MDYWDYLVKGYQMVADTVVKTFNNRYGSTFYVNDYLTDIHPKSETQYEIQRGLGSVWSWYANWMRGRSLDEFNQNKKDMYDVDFHDQRYPWLSTLDSTNGLQAMGSGAWEYSRNLSRLYR